jgi:uncharacterized protein YsxB (DUF464 family)
MKSADVLNYGYTLVCFAASSVLFACAYWIAKAAWKNNGNTNW